MLIINGHLMFPPSEVSCFRDITLYVHVFVEVPVVVQVESKHVDDCYRYMKQTGSFDYVQDIIAPQTETGVILSDSAPYHVRARKLWAGNLNRVINDLKTRLIVRGDEPRWFI
jgi:hypothetical protein